MSIYFLPVNGAKGFAIIDAEDYEKVSGFKWQVEYSGLGKHHIGCRIGDKSEGQKCFRLSHIILGVENSDELVRVKYLNENPFDCRKSNLEFSVFGNNYVKGDNWTLNKYSDKNRKVCKWVVSVYNNSEQKNYKIGYYKSEAAADAVIDFIKERKLDLSSKEGIGNTRPIIREWALEKGLTNPPRYLGTKPEYKIGDEKTDDKGFIRVKTRSGWQLKHHFVWKQSGKRLPKKHYLIFKDGNKRNFELSNLEAISPQEKGHRLRLSQQPADVRDIVDVVWQINKAAEKIRNKPTQIIKIDGKSVKVATEDYQKVIGYDWKILGSQGKKYVGFRKKIADGKYKIITLAHVIFDAEGERIRLGFKNRNCFDYRRRNLDIVFSDRKDAVRTPSFYCTFVKNRKGAKSNWKVDVSVINKRAALGYYLSEESAKTVIKFTEKLTPPTDWDSFLQFREDVRAWAIENGHAQKSYRAVGKEQRGEHSFSLAVRFLKKPSPQTSVWRVSMSNRAISKHEYHFDTYRTEAVAQAVVDFINGLGLPITNREEADKVKELVRAWVNVKGYRNRPSEQHSIPQKFNSENTGEVIVCQTLQ